jgi:thiamine transport system substrate-binding protein
MLTKDFQAALPDAMYVFPVDASVALPDDWASFAKRPDQPLTVDPADIASHREEWLQQWSDITSR